MTWEQAWSGVWYRYRYGTQVQARQAVRASKQETVLVQWIKTEPIGVPLLGSFGRRVACVGGCAGCRRRAGERVGLRVLLELLLYIAGAAGDAVVRGGVIWPWVGFVWARTRTVL